MKRTRLTTSLALLAASALILTACAPPEDEKDDATTDSGVKASEATSAEDFGGLDALVEAAQEEGQLNVIALPPDWANYGEMISTFSEKYDIEVESAQPDVGSQDEINAAEQLKGTDRAPDVFDLGQAVAVANTAIFAPYKVETWDTIPEGFKEDTGLWTNDYGGFMAIGYDSAVVPDITSVADLMKPAYKGKVALNGDPTVDGAAFTGVLMTAVANGGSADDIAPGVEFFKDLKKAGNYLPVDPDSPPSSRARRPSSSTGTTSAERQQPTSTPGRSSFRRKRSLPATTTRRSMPTRLIRRPPGCGRSSSSAMRVRTSGSRVVPAPCEHRRWLKPARSIKHCSTPCPRSPAPRWSRRPSRARRCRSTWSRTGPTRSDDPPASGYGAVGLAEFRRPDRAAHPLLHLCSHLLVRADLTVIIGALQSEGGGVTLSNVRAIGSESAVRALRGSYLRLIRECPHRCFGGGGACLLHRATLTTSLMRRITMAVSGVLAQFGGVTLAFSFIAAYSYQGVVTVALRDNLGIDIFGSGWMYGQWGITLVYTFFQIPLMVIVFLPAMEGVRPQWREAAVSLGATTRQYWLQVAVPLLRPAFLGCALLLFANAFAAYAPQPPGHPRFIHHAPAHSLGAHQ